MAEKVRMQALYRVFYGGFSKVTHGHAIDRHISFEKSQVIYEPIRSPSDFEQVLKISLTLAFRIYRAVLRKYRSEEFEVAFGIKYFSE